MLTKEERRMITAITAAAMMVSLSSAVSIVKNLSSPKAETHVYLPQTADTVAPSSQSKQSPVCMPISFPDAKENKNTVSNLSYVETAVLESEATYISEIPLSEELQTVMQDACLEYDVPYALALAVCEAESSFQPDADSGTCWGLMQINPVNFNWLRNEGIEPTTYTGNITAGVYMLGQLLDTYEDTHKALMAYNCGDIGASRLWECGYLTSTYSENVIEKSDKWQKVIIDNITGGKNYVGN